MAAGAFFPAVTVGLTGNSGRLLDKPFRSLGVCIENDIFHASEQLRFYFVIYLQH